MANTNEEDWTIKCVCGYDDDDGSTVLCEECDTWQHILCYYYKKTIPDIHLCTDCAPENSKSDVNVREAKDRQRKQRSAGKARGL